MNNKKIKITTDSFPIQRGKDLIQKSSKNRSWMEKSLIKKQEVLDANNLGLTLYTEFPFSLVWDGGEDQEGVDITFEEDYDNLSLLPRITSELGNGIVTIKYPFFLKTEKGIDLIAINPINNLIPAASILNSVINQEEELVVNLKMQIPEVILSFPKGFAISSIIPVSKEFYDIELI